MHALHDMSATNSHVKTEQFDLCWNGERYWEFTQNGIPKECDTIILTKYLQNWYNIDHQTTFLVPYTKVR